MFGNSDRCASIETVQALIDQGIDFIYDNQLPWGEIANYSFVSNSQLMKTYRSTVFPTALVLHSISFLDDSNRLNGIKQKAIEFIIQNKEESYWRYFGIGSELPLDLDTTSCCLSVLYELGVMNDLAVPEKLLGQRDEVTKLFRTWVGGSPISENDFDAAVNANILWLFSLMHKSFLTKEVIDWLNRESHDLQTQNSQRWYFSPQIFSCFVSRAFAVDRADELQEARGSIVRYLRFVQDENGGWGNTLETAFALVALMDCAAFGTCVERGIEYLMDRCDRDRGCWPMEILYPFGGDGSEEITTAVCLEALQKYKKHIATDLI